MSLVVALDWIVRRMFTALLLNYVGFLMLLLNCAGPRQPEGLSSWHSMRAEKHIYSLFSAAVAFFFRHMMYWLDRVRRIASSFALYRLHHTLSQGIVRLILQHSECRVNPSMT